MRSHPSQPCSDAIRSFIKFSRRKQPRASLKDVYVTSMSRQKPLFRGVTVISISLNGHRNTQYSGWIEALHVYKDAFRRQTRRILMILEFPSIRMNRKEVLARTSKRNSIEVPTQLQRKARKLKHTPDLSQLDSQPDFIHSRRISISLQESKEYVENLFHR